MNAIVAIGVGVAFLVLQVFIFSKAKASARNRCVEWVGSCKSGNRRAQTRESAILDLERSLASNPNLALLRRLGVIAPLLGVVLTAVGVIFGLANKVGLLQSELSESSSFVPAAREIITPLFWGVFVGAALAIVNQFFLYLLSRDEDATFAACVDPGRATGFRDTEDRLDMLMRQFEEAGQKLGQSAKVVDSMMSTAWAAIEGMNAACNAAATDLGSMATRLHDAMHAPAKDFADAAGAMRKSALATMKQFETGIAALSKQASLVERRITQALGRNLDGIQAQERTASAAMEAARSLQVRIDSLPANAFETLSVQLRTADAAVGALSASIVRFASELPDATARLSSELSSQTERAASQLKSSVDSMGPTSQQFGAGLERAASSIETIGQTAETVTAALLRLNSSAEDRASAERNLRTEVEAAGKSLRELESRITRLPIDQVCVRTGELQAKIQDLSRVMAAVSATVVSQAERLRGEAQQPETDGQPSRGYADMREHPASPARQQAENETGTGLEVKR